MKRYGGSLEEWITADRPVVRVRGRGSGEGMVGCLLLLLVLATLVLAVYVSGGGI